MDASIRTGTSLRQRMIDDMRMRKLEQKTQEAYIRAVCKLAAFLRRAARQRHGRRSATLPAALGRSGELADHAECDPDWAEVLLRHHA